ncbi:MAG: response regulator [Gallionella sp.]
MDTGRCSVLLVDVELAQIDFARLAAAAACPEVELAAVDGGDAALDWFEAGLNNLQQMPQIILLDLKLPKLDGLAVLRKLRSHAVTSEIPVVVFSAEYTQDEVLMSYKAGANTFVAKPVDVAGYAEIFQQRLSHWIHPQPHNPVTAATDGAMDGAAEPA